MDRAPLDTLCSEVAGTPVCLPAWLNAEEHNRYVLCVCSFQEEPKQKFTCLNMILAVAGPRVVGGSFGSGWCALSGTILALCC